ncbi:hypothetical protein O0544_18630 [Edwardsiella anguillarum]|nr:hypothetical protein [Edwardsiella anguillarum]
MAGPRWRQGVQPAEDQPAFDGDPHYRTDDRQPTIPQSHMALFWADIPIGRPIPVNADRWHSSACRSRVSAPDRRGSPTPPQT